jgi:hypothetical protein
LAIALLSVAVLTTIRFNQSLWSDEASSVWFARQPINTLFTALCDPHPAGYYVALQAWLIGGESEPWLRLLSLGAGLLTVVVTYQLAVERFDRKVADTAALLLALQPLQAWYASEVRMYAWAECLGVLAVWLGWLIIAPPLGRSSTRRLWWLYGGIAALALWIDYSAIFPLALLQLMWIAYGTPHARRWLILHGAVALPIGLLALISGQGLALSNNIYPIFIAIQAANLGITLTPEIAAILLQVATVLTGLLALGVALLWRRRNLLSQPTIRWGIVAAWLICLILAALPQAFTVKRRLVMVVPYLAIASAYLMAHWSQFGQRSVLAAGALAAVLAIFTLQREPWREVIAPLLATAHAETDVVWVDELSVPAFDYYARQSALGNGSLRWAPLISRVLPQTPELIPAADGRLWLITAESSYRHLSVFLPSDFRANYQVVSELHTRGIGLYEYRRTAQPISAPPAPVPSLTEQWGLRLLSPLDTCTR